MIKVVKEKLLFSKSGRSEPFFSKKLYKHLDFFSQWAITESMFILIGNVKSSNINLKKCLVGSIKSYHFRGGLGVCILKGKNLNRIHKININQQCSLLCIGFAGYT